MDVYVIRHKATGQLMPEMKRRGYSHWNPTTGVVPTNARATPRLLPSAVSATRCIAQWAANPNGFNSYQSRTWYDPDGDSFVDSKPDGRAKTDLEVVPMQLIETSVQENAR